MDLLEYQAKELFRLVGIPVMPSQRIDRAADMKHLTIAYPVVLKSQVYLGGRGRVGGVRFVENTIDAIAAAQAIFNLPIMGEYPRALLAEAKYEAEAEFYLAIALNRSSRRPVLLGSMQGGVNMQSAIDQMQQVVVDGDFSPFYARRLALAMGLEGALMNVVSDVLERMYRLFVEKDLDLVEINPLGVNDCGQVMALDGKVTVNDGALARHPDLAAMRDGGMVSLSLLSGTSELPIMLEKDGEIALVCNGSGLTLATIDWIDQAGGKPFCSVNIGGETDHAWSIEKFSARLIEALLQIAQYAQVKVVLINLASGIIPQEALVKAVLSFLQNRSGLVRAEEPGVTRLNFAPKIVVRLAGAQAFSQGGELLTTALNHPQVTVCDELEVAIATVVKIAKKRGNSNAH
jgi:succinyl-CoA synthetase beta subunit